MITKNGTKFDVTTDFLIEKHHTILIKLAFLNLLPTSTQKTKLKPNQTLFDRT